MILIHKIAVETHLQAESFEEFSRTRYLPAMHLEATRRGLLSEVRIMRNDKEFLLISDWNGLDQELPLVDPPVQKLFDAYRPEVTLIGEYREVARRAQGDS